MPVRAELLCCHLQPVLCRWHSPQQCPPSLRFCVPAHIQHQVCFLQVTPPVSRDGFGFFSHCSSVVQGIWGYVSFTKCFHEFPCTFSPYLSQSAHALNSCLITTGEDVLVHHRMASGQGMEHSLMPWGWSLSLAQSPVKFYSQGHLCSCHLSEKAQMLLCRGGAHSTVP